MMTLSMPKIPAAEFGSIPFNIFFRSVFVNIFDFTKPNYYLNLLKDVLVFFNVDLDIISVFRFSVKLASFNDSNKWKMALSYL